MKKEKKKIIFISIIVFLVLASFVVGMVGHKFYVDKKIEISNVYAYQFLQCIKSCDIIYNINLNTNVATSEFDKKCENSCVEFLKKIPFKPGEITDDKLIVESSEYNECLVQKSTDAEKYKSCVTKLILEIEKNYPEVLEN